MKQMLKLFTSLFVISACTFGGGYVIVSLMKKKFVDELHWIDQEEMLNLIAIAQLSPGAVAVNGAVVVGYRLGGFWGVLVGVLATILPPFLIISILSIFYTYFISNVLISTMLAGMQAGVAAVIVSACMELLLPIVQEKQWASLLIFPNQCLCDCVSWLGVRCFRSIKMLGKLFLAFLQIGCMSFGGGYASLPLIQQVVLQHHWLNKTEMAQLITISHLCWSTGCRDDGWHYRNSWVYFPGFVDMYDFGYVLYALSETGFCAKGFCAFTTNYYCFDWSWGYFYSAK